MKNVSAVLPVSARVPDPVSEGSLDELHDTLIPVQEDELPQGVLALMANLILHHRPVMETGHALARHSMADGQGAVEAERGEARWPAVVDVLHSQTGPLLHKPIPHPKPQLISSSMPQPVTPAITVEPALIESPANGVEPLPVDHAVSSAPAIDMQLSEASLRLQTTRHASPVAQPPVPSPTMPQPLSVLELKPESLPRTERGLLQVPFNSGAASGQVTISRMTDEPTRNLLLSPSNALVFDQIKTALDLTRDAGWQLTDNEGEQRGRGTHQPSDDEQAEQQDLPA
ncbi:SpaN/EivJ family type III secretion system needle length determinant [Pseudomonas baetica]|uniref:SpaN/EivJ family type III secretion system needle length determinant n=1 Tax=Pseudomonas baetica TaxID=674054 RepID=UPI003EEB584F